MSQFISAATAATTARVPDNKMIRGRSLRRPRNLLIAAAAAALPALAAVTTSAAPLYWDMNGTATGSSNSTHGSWGVTNSWNSDPNGTAVPGAWIAGSTAVFSAGTNATGATSATVSGTQSLAGMTFEEGTITLNGG